MELDPVRRRGVLIRLNQQHHRLRQRRRPQDRAATVQHLIDEVLVAALEQDDCSFDVDDAGAASDRGLRKGVEFTLEVEPASAKGTHSRSANAVTKMAPRVRTLTITILVKNHLDGGPCHDIHGYLVKA